MELQPSSAEHNKEGSPDADEMRVSDSNDVDDVIPEELSDSDCCIVLQKSGERELKVNLIDVDEEEDFSGENTKKFKEKSH